MRWYKEYLTVLEKGFRTIFFGLDNTRGKYCVCMHSDMIFPFHYIQIVMDNWGKKNKYYPSNLILR